MLKEAENITYLFTFPWQHCIPNIEAEYYKIQSCRQYREFNSPCLCRRDKRKGNHRSRYSKNVKHDVTDGFVLFVLVT